MTAGSPGPPRAPHPLQAPDLAGSAVPGTGLWGRARGGEAGEGGRGSPPPAGRRGPCWPRPRRSEPGAGSRARGEPGAESRAGGAGGSRAAQRGRGGGAWPVRAPGRCVQRSALRRAPAPPRVPSSPAGRPRRCPSFLDFGGGGRAIRLGDEDLSRKLVPINIPAPGSCLRRGGRGGAKCSAAGAELRRAARGGAEGAARGLLPGAAPPWEAGRCPPERRPRGERRTLRLQRRRERRCQSQASRGGGDGGSRGHRVWATSGRGGREGGRALGASVLPGAGEGVPRAPRMSGRSF